MSKNIITRFDLEAAFKALDEIKFPEVSGTPNRSGDLKENYTKMTPNTSVLFEDFYDVNSQEDLNKAKQVIDDDVAKAKLAKIEQIVDLDAKTPDDLQPSYVGKDIIQCPRCQTLFYKDPNDVVPSDDNPEIVNKGETCQHCGNEDGYNLIGKVAEVPEEKPVEEEPVEETPEEVPAEEEPADEESEETNEEQLENDTELEELPDLPDLDMPEEEEPEEEKKEANESYSPLAEDINISNSDMDKLFNSEEFKTPITDAEVRRIIASEAYEPEDSDEKECPDCKDKEEAADVNETDDKEDVKKLFDAWSMNHTITESLKSVYENVKRFRMTECKFTQEPNKALCISGNITFNSGRIRPVSYIFTESKSDTENNNIILEGCNKSLTDNGKFYLELSKHDNNIVTESFGYSYTINDDGKDYLVENLIRR